MAIKHKGHFFIGLSLFISFLVVLFLIFSNIFPGGLNGLEYADEMFNKLSKGSSYFIPKVTKSNEKFMGDMFSVTLKMGKAEVMGTELKIEGDLGKILSAALRDSETMYRNEGEKIKVLYATAMKTDDVKQMYRQWYNVLDRMNKKFVIEKKAAEAKICSDVMKKAVEAAYNYYEIEPEKVKDKMGLMIFLLVFYVVYTLWWGFAIFYMFEGIGLSMKKAKVKKEV